MDGKEKNNEQRNNEQTNDRKIKKCFSNISSFLAKQRYIREVLLALCLTVLVFTIFMVQAFHDAEEFKDTSIARKLISEQEALVHEYNILPNLDEMSGGSIVPYFRNTNFLDSNYQFSVKVGDKTYQTFSNWNVDYVNTVTLEYDIKNGENGLKKKTNIYIESYLNKVFESEGAIYNNYRMFSKIHNNMNGIITFIAVMLVLVLVLTVMLFASSLKKDKRIAAEWKDKIPLELLLLMFLIVFAVTITIESNKTYVLYQLSYFSYGEMLVELLTCFFVAIVVIETLILKFANGTWKKNSMIGFIISFLKKVMKPMFANADAKKDALCIIIGTTVIEGIYLLYLLDHIPFGIDGIVISFLVFEIVKFIYTLHLYSRFLKIHIVTKELQKGEINAKVETKGMHGIVREHGECINHISEGLKSAIAEKMKSEQLKVELITNVSHDIKTPLTSIINYVDLMKKEEVENPKIKEYLAIVDKQSLRLKDLTDNVIEASKAATGNMEVNLTDINVGEIMSQALGEYENKFNQIHLQTVYTPGEGTKVALGDGKLLWRVLDNLFSNVNKYTLEGTRFYVNISETQDFCVITLKNISKYQLNISAEELSQRFVRGDTSRNTQGNGLGLSIAQSLMSLQGGELKMEINGDLFVVNLYLAKKEE
ncbi:MAG: HAMP domain-containing histidine kinase [Lachnospiraceae bacterium]|nr:HAMP domain-containing histidine kinase [Lachnospiraceae bacterium]